MLAGRDLFKGLVAVVDLSVKGENNKEVEEEIKRDIVARGGKVLDLARSKEGGDEEKEEEVTHLVVADMEKEAVRRTARRKSGRKAVAVTEWWIDQCIENNELVCKESEVVYSPPRSSGGISSEMKDLVVCVTGYSGFRRHMMRELVLRTGASYSGTLNRSCTHLVCYRYEGEKYQTAKKWQASFNSPSIVNHRWVEDCLRTWSYLSEPIYEDKCGEEVDREPRIPLNELIKLEVENSFGENSEDYEEEGHRSRYVANRTLNRQKGKGKESYQFLEHQDEEAPDLNNPAGEEVEPMVEEKEAEDIVMQMNTEEKEVAEEPEVEDVVVLNPAGGEKENPNLDVESFPLEGKENVAAQDARAKSSSQEKENITAGPDTKRTLQSKSSRKVDTERKRLRELKSLQLFSWDSQCRKFPPGEKLSNNAAENLARKRVQPDRLDTSPPTTGAPKKRKSPNQNVKKVSQNKKGKQTFATTPKAKSRALHISLSGMRTKVRLRCQNYAEKCGLLIAESKTKEWNKGTTHLITPQLGRSEKTLAAMASGAWILNESWLRDSAKAKRALDEKDFFAESTNDSLVAPNAAELWHRHCQQTKEKAFQGIQALFHKSCGENTPSRDTLVRIFKAGGGEVVQSAPGGRDSNKIKIAIVPNSLDSLDYSKFKESGMVLVTDLFLIEWLAFPKKGLEEHIQSSEALDHLSDCERNLWNQKVSQRC